MRRTPALAAVLLLALPATAHAAAPQAPAPPPLTPVDVVPAATAATSAAWQDRDGTTHVLRDDQPLGGETVLHPPADCAVGALTAADVAYTCPAGRWDFSRIWLQDRRTEVLRSSPIAFDVSGAGAEIYTLRGIGAALAEIHTTGGPHVDAHSDYRRLSDGRRVPTAVRTSRHRAVSLDAPSGTVRLCAPLTNGTHEESGVDEVNGEYTETVYDQALYRAPWLLTVHRGRVLLKRCGRRAARDLGQALDDTQLVLTARYAAWGSPRFAFSWNVRRLAGGPTSRVAPRLGAGSWHVAATDHRFWLGDYQGKAYMISP